MRRIIDTTEKVTTVNNKTLSLLKRNLLPDEVLFDLVENTKSHEAESKILAIVNTRISKKYPNLQKTAPLVFERYTDLLKSHIEEKVEECLMPKF